MYTQNVDESTCIFRELRGENISRMHIGFLACGMLRRQGWIVVENYQFGLVNMVMQSDWIRQLWVL